MLDLLSGLLLMCAFAYVGLRMWGAGQRRLGLYEGRVDAADDSRFGSPSSAPSVGDWSPGQITSWT
jgi:hypothetical protein